MTKRLSLNYRLVQIRVPLNPNAHKLMNQLHNANLGIRNVKVSDKYIYFEISHSALPLIRRLRHKYKLPLKVNYVSDQAIFRFDAMTIIGMLLLMIIPIVASQWIWRVEVKSDIPELRVDIEETLHEALQLNPPFFKKNLLDDMKIRQLLLEKHRNLAWVHIEKNGSAITFRPQLAPELVEIPKKITRPMDLVAAKSGVITHFDIERGVRSVATNTTVYKGDLLVSGVIAKGEKSLVIGASGAVYADYWLECTFSIPKTVEMKGKESTSWHILVKWLNSETFEAPYYNKKELPDILSPYVKIVETQTTNTLKRQITEDSIPQLVMPLLHQKILQSLPPKTVIKKQNLLHVQIDDDTVKGKVLYLINENIAKTQPVNQGE